MDEQARAALPAHEVDGELGRRVFGVGGTRDGQLDGEAGVGEDEAHRDQLLIAPFRRGPMHRTPRSLGYARNMTSDHDPRNRSDAEYESMPGTLVDSTHNMPGDQPEDDTPPSKTRADGTDASSAD